MTNRVLSPLIYMAISNPFVGTLQMDNTFKRIYPPQVLDILRSPRWVEGWIYFHEFTTGDEAHVRVYEYDDYGQQFRIYDEPIIVYTGALPATDVHATPACHIGAVLSNWIRIEVAQTAGEPNYKSINYKFFEVT